MTRRSLGYLCTTLLLAVASAQSTAAGSPNGHVHGQASYDPGPCDSTFPDVDVNSPLCPWIEQLVADGISEGCGDDGNGGTNFCPDQPVTRGQMARFLERAMRGTTTWDVTAASQTWASAHRRYYLTVGSHDGEHALDACDTGYHMASLSEILDPTELVYLVGELAYSHADSGSGAPVNTLGWLRTGTFSDTTNLPGVGNCAGWTSSENFEYGTAVRLYPDFGAYLNDDANSDSVTRRSGAWAGVASNCFDQVRVWCIEN